MLRPHRPSARQRFERFCSENAWWLDDFVLFDALRAQHKLASWNEWPAELAHREPGALEQARKDLAIDLKIRSALQFAFYEQWQALRRYCSERSIRIVGDVAIFVNYDSADVWMHPRTLPAESRILSLRSSPACLLISSARPGSAGEILFTAGT